MSGQKHPASLTEEERRSGRTEREGTRNLYPHRSTLLSGMIEKWNATTCLYALALIKTFNAADVTALGQDFEVVVPGTI
jgi:hypothetical protein